MLRLHRTDDPLRAPLIAEAEIQQSPLGDDLTDPGQSEVFDESHSESKKFPGKQSQKEARVVDSRDIKANEERKVKESGKRENSIPTEHARNIKSETVRILDRKVRDPVESQDLSGNRLPLTSKYTHKSKVFNFPEVQQDESNYKEHFKDHRDSTKKHPVGKVSAAPESANREFVYKDGRHDRKPSTPLMKNKHRKSGRRGSEDSRRKSPGSQTCDTKDVTVTSREQIVSPANDKIKKERTRTSTERGSKHSDSPSRKRKSLRNKKIDLPPTVVVDLHGPDAEYDKRKRDSLQNQNIEEKDDAMHTIPLIKVGSIFIDIQSQTN